VEVLVVLAVLAVAVALIGGPLRTDRRSDGDSAQSAARADLEAAKEAKLREIREAELDHRLGKLSPQDWRALDAALRREAVGLLREIDALEQRKSRDLQEDRQRQG
jgi:hypothetical protein